MKWAGGGLALVLIAGVIWIMQAPVANEFGRVVVLLSADNQTAGNGLEQSRDAITDAGMSLTAKGGGELIILKAGGGPAREVATSDLLIKGPDGQPEHDREVIEGAAKAAIDKAFSDATAARVSGEGRNVLSLLTAAADHAPPAGQPFDIFMVGFGLGTVDPADARVQLAADPGQAVAAAANRLPRLDDATIHLIFPAAAGEQEPLNVATVQWRRAYWEDLASAVGARIGDVTATNVPADPAPNANPAPTIPNIEDPTPVPPAPIPDPTPPGEPQPEPPPTRLGGGMFLPDSAEFADLALATAQLTPIAEAWISHPGAYGQVLCIGRTANVGPPDGAIALSQLRAAAAGGLLTSLGVTNVVTEGKGYSSPVPDLDPLDPAQRSVSCQLIPNV